MVSSVRQHERGRDEFDRSHVHTAQCSDRIHGSITIGTQTLNSNATDVAITRLNQATGAATLAAQFGSPATDRMALVYTVDKLAGVGTFSGTTALFGSSLVAEGGTDIATFRVDF